MSVIDITKASIQADRPLLRGSRASWVGEQPPLPSPIDILRIARIYDQTAAFYDEVVARSKADRSSWRWRCSPDDRRPVLEAGVGTAWAFERLIAASGAHGNRRRRAPGMLDVARDRLPNATLMLADALRRRSPVLRSTACPGSYTPEVLPDGACCQPCVSFTASCVPADGSSSATSRMARAKRTRR
jgi:hypothetical protein